MNMKNTLVALLRELHDQDGKPSIVEYHCQYFLEPFLKALEQIDVHLELSIIMNPIQMVSLQKARMVVKSR